jgi:hypothetical protein
VKDLCLKVGWLPSRAPGQGLQGQCKMTACWLGVESEYEALVLFITVDCNQIPCCRSCIPRSSAPETCTIGF